MRRILITGITGGIGEASGDLFLTRGDAILGIARDTSSLSDKWSGRDFHGIDFDLNNIDRLPELFQKNFEMYGPIDGFIHCAGFDKMAPLSMTKAKDMEKLWRIHAQVPMLMISLLSKKKYHGEKTSIVLISSQSAHEGAMGHSAYASAKGALEGYLPAAAAELMEKNIRINILSLAPVKTQMADEWMDRLPPDARDDLVKTYPLGIMDVESVAKNIVFLLSDESRYINGQIITIDGGHAVRKV